MYGKRQFRMSRTYRIIYCKFLILLTFFFDGLTGFLIIIILYQITHHQLLVCCLLQLDICIISIHLEGCHEGLLPGCIILNRTTKAVCCTCQQSQILCQDLLIIFPLRRTYLLDLIQLGLDPSNLTHWVHCSDTRRSCLTH